ncbi:hypothetical protein SAMN05444279_1632 [Ruegeria intermedia]|uniref:Uncharacterized protein n=1 Tax=Ruegeria intermedia TaxID=996115 RepID=A0A1M5BZ85_9RHOB|nr:hypothetical protein SAMN05444279_1632 [Ruegeria intermedia]
MTKTTMDLTELLAKQDGGRMDDVNRTFSVPTARSRTLGTFSGTGPIPVMTSRSGR